MQASFAPVAKHYGAIVEPCPPRRGNRKGAVESSVRFASGRWWRTMSATEPEEAQRSSTSSAPPPVTSANAGADGSAPPSRAGRRRALLALPAVPFPATIEVERSSPTTPASPSRATATRCRPGSRARDVVRHRLGSPTIDVVAPSGAILVTHRLAPPGWGALVRSPSTKRPSRPPCSPPSPRPGRATRKPTGRRAEALEERPACSAPAVVSRSSTSSVYDEIAGGPVSEASIYQQLVSPRLPASGRCRRGAARRARPARTDKLGHTEFLARLLEVEVTATETRRRAGLERSPACPPRGGSRTSTSTPSPRSTRNW